MFELPFVEWLYRVGGHDTFKMKVEHDCDRRITKVPIVPGKLLLCFFHDSILRFVSLILVVYTFSHPVFIA